MHDATISRDGLLLKNRVSGVRTRVVHQPDGTFIIETFQDSAPILDEIARKRLVANDNYHRDQRHKHIGELPFVIYMRLVDKLGRPSENPTGWAKWWNDSAHNKLRVLGGRV